ncbi:C40 family peptidase [Confluentibacter sediminis]|uniref:C40 family peptidase n=1 Tax=Confluentibacter sediminis TaxID=2219045 RepID=UPI000DABDC31|nr:C40 family peptidase [Confluentibacter sediminis]
MKTHVVVLCILFLSFSSCKSSKQTKSKESSSSKVIIGSNSNQEINPNKSITTRDITTHSRHLNSSESKAYNIVEYAKQFEGVRYKFGGATKSGMDCSGLVFESFRAFNIILPRISRDMAKNGEKISLNDVEEGDLLFFKTGNRRNDISHVGLVVSSRNGNIEFIHSTTSAGVIISSITENYWDRTFAEARRIL